jgi:GR25 family glycosyltransferase involved in LPS biosynthesis
MSESLRDYFDRVVAINLDRRPDRWERLKDHLEDINWPFRTPERMSAVDGDATTVPIWWKQGGGAWGCLMSHARILEDCIGRNVRRVLILEDDVVFTDDFSEAVEGFLSDVPPDWDQLYFGGQHLRNPTRLSEHVYSCANINRTHCHAVSRKFMPRMYRHILNAYDYIDHPGHHVDHRLGVLQETGTVQVFAPVNWLAGQRAGHSDISGRANATHFWNTWAGVPDMTLYVVLGLHAGRGNEIAGLMKSLGVHFGHHLEGFHEPKMEDVGLAYICEQVFPFPSIERKMGVRESAPMLHDWIALVQREAANYGVVAAACYPQLCAMRADLTRAWRNIEVIDVRVPIDQAVAALLGRRVSNESWRDIGREEAVAAQRFLDQSRKDWSQDGDVFTVDAARLDQDRQGLISDLRGFLNLRRRSEAELTG